MIDVKIIRDISTIEDNPHHDMGENRRFSYVVNLRKSAKPVPFVGYRAISYVASFNTAAAFVLQPSIILMKYPPMSGGVFSDKEMLEQEI